MASIRQLKKDIDYLVSQVVVDCFLYNRFFEGAREEASHEIMEEILGLGGELRKRMNQPGKINDPKALRNHYRMIGQDLLTGCDKAYHKLGKLMEKES
jgi:hypothetical protein